MASSRKTSAPAHDAPTETYAALRELMSAFPQLNGWLGSRMGLSRSDVDGLLLIGEQPMGPSELATRLGLTQAAGSQVVDRLQVHGLVERASDPADARRVIVSGTAKAYPEVARHLQPVFNAMQEIESEFTAAELATVRRYLGRATDALNVVL
ncbi:MAG: MarR family winged helix-turn-helix transcriptional regulator [Gaiellales bacterium]